MFDIGWIRWERNKVVVCVMVSPSVPGQSSYVAKVDWSLAHGVTSAEVVESGVVPRAVVDWLMYSHAAADRILEAYLKRRMLP